MRIILIGLLLAVTAGVHAAPSARRCARVCGWARERCATVFRSVPEPKRCTKGVIKRCGGLAACFPATTTTMVPTSTTSTSTTVTPTTTTGPTTTLSPGLSEHVRLILLDDCLSSSSCSTGDGEPKVCGEADPFFDATVSVSPRAADGTFTVQLDLGADYPPMTCQHDLSEVCWDDGERNWCGPAPYASCGAPLYVFVDRTTIELRIGNPAPDTCADIYRGDVVP